MVQVVEIDERRLGGVVEREPQVAGVGRGDRLGARGQRRVANGDALVVVEVARPLLGRELIGEELHREHEVRLLDDLLAIEIEVGEVQHQRILIRPRRVEVPQLVLGEALGLLMHAELLVERDDDAIGGGAPGRHLRRRDAELARARPGGARRRRRRRRGSASPSGS